ncbi:flagellar biosynthesis protein FlgA [Paracoccus luteus]|uniref:flagellar biosynthesis protein FlgA n=1 Tax=Paracoccus luteus TaxID=2508543 RepID=UPI0010705A3D|nr:flagellar biosynthesis protein FlgA [Paracoccus luteus]
MNHHSYFARPRGRVVETCILGTGGFGQSYLAQVPRVPGLSCRLAVDVDAGRACAALVAAGADPAQVAQCDTPAEALAAWDAGRLVATGDFAAIASLPFEVAIEATGSPEAGARHARMAIAAGRHVVMVTKETDSVIGPELARMAAARGVVVTPADGDQPSLLIGLVTWAEVLGLTILCAGKSSEYDFVFDPATGQVTSNGRTVPAPGLADWLDPAGRPWAVVAAGRADAAAALPQRAVPDLCELTLVANATGLSPDRPDLHAPILRIPEIAGALTTADRGGLLAGAGRLDVFHCLRLSGEASFAGGVFVTVACDDAATWRMLGDKGHILSADGRSAAIALPRHLLGVEVATSVFEAALLGRSSGAERPRPRIDLTAWADIALEPGTLLTAQGHHHSIHGVSGRMTPAGPLGDGAAVPYYLAAGRRVIRRVAAGQAIRVQDLDMGGQSELATIRRNQDRNAI